MLATILLLAQLVLPGPPSGLIQPPGMICLGECAGPVVWGPAERSRLVVACDMRSDTCSDGRQITTQRATPVPCETSPGVWEMVPENTGCYSVRGLELWAATTSYLSYGAELDRSPWGALRGGTIEVLADGYRVTSAAGEAGVSGRIQVLSAQPEEGPVTLSCIVRTQQPIGRLTLEAGTGVSRHFAPFDTAGKWEIVSVSGAIAAGAARWVGVGPRNTDLTPASVDVKACWYTYTSTPGRPCWGGAAPVTCATERHIISTEGWPTESGEISISFRVDEWAPGTRGYIVDGRTSGDTSHTILLITTDGRLRLDLVAGAGQALGPVVSLGEDHTVRLKVENGRTLVFYDGAKVIDVAGTPTWSHAAHIGHSLIAAEHLNGSIRSLTVRSFE